MLSAPRKVREMCIQFFYFWKLAKSKIVTNERESEIVTITNGRESKIVALTNEREKVRLLL